MNEQDLRAVIDTTPESVMLLSPEGAILETNPAGLRMSEADSLEAITGSCIDKVVAPEDVARFMEFHRAVCHGRRGRLIYDLVGLRGGRRTVETLSAPLKGDDDRVRHLAISRDITETRQLEEQLRHAQKMEAIGQLAGGVAHDFNNLLTIVLGYCDILGERQLPQAEQELVDEIRKAGERAAALTRQLLAFSRRQVREPRVLNPNAIVGDMQRMLRRLIGENIALACRLDRGLWPVKADVGQMEQVIVNLVVNARDAMPNGGSLLIATENIEWTEAQSERQPDRAAGRYAAVSVTDTGSGMTAEVQGRIFEPFFTTKELGRGTGLGLSVVHGIVEQSEGFVDVRSKLGVGTTFTVHLPAVGGVVEYKGGHRGDDVPTRGTETVLLVEDQEELRKLLRLALESQGYEVVEAANGRAAVGKAADLASPIDIVVTDVVMPELSGREMVEQLRERWPELKALFVSGYSDDALLRHAIMDANNGFLQKPFAPLALATKIREMLDDVKRSRHLLFVDDEAPLVYLATRTLEEQGYRVSGCASAADALAAFMRDPLGFDLVVTDLNMKGMSGLQLAEQLRALRPELPVILASGYVDEKLKAEAAAIGVSEVLCKPSSIEELGVEIHRAAARLAPL